MFWLFAAVVLVLAVCHPGFRKVLLWAGGIAAALVLIGLAVGGVTEYMRQAQAARETAAAHARSSAIARACAGSKDPYCELSPVAESGSSIGSFAPYAEELAAGASRSSGASSSRPCSGAPSGDPDAEVVFAEICVKEAGSSSVYIGDLPVPPCGTPGATTCSSRSSPRHGQRVPPDDSPCDIPGATGCPAVH
jgi:hypothetical protein